MATFFVAVSGFVISFNSFWSFKFLKRRRAAAGVRYLKCLFPDKIGKDCASAVERVECVEKHRARVLLEHKPVQAAACERSLTLLAAQSFGSG